MDTKDQKVETISGKSANRPLEVSDTQKKPVLAKIKEALKKGLDFVWKDMTKQHLIWVKIIFFLQSASLVTLYPYLV